MEISERLIRSGMKLDKHYIPTRYPNGFDTGAPKEYYTEESSMEDIQAALLQVSVPVDLHLLKPALFQQKAAAGTGIAAVAARSGIKLL
jgi:hypothetical protein